MRASICLLLAVVLGGCANLQHRTARQPLPPGEISGRVLDLETRQPVAGAMIRLGGTNRGTLADRSGRFVLRDIAPGPHRLEVQMLGFESHEEALVLSARQGVTVDIMLPPYGAKSREGSAQLAELRRNRALWRRHRPAAYRFELEVDCFCFSMFLSPLRVEVRRGRVKVPGHASVGNVQAYSIDGIFKEIESIIRDRAYRVEEVVYHPELGIPLLWRSDSAVPGISDVWSTTRIRNFQALPRGTS